MPILWIYGRMVGEGEWRDYAIDHLKDRAVFSVFKRSGEMPLFRIEKNPKLAAKQGAYSVINTHGVDSQARTRPAAGTQDFQQVAEAGREMITP
jgi:hypothetical protein